VYRPLRIRGALPQDRIVLEKFADHWDKDRYFRQGVVFLPYATVSLANLRAGQLDMIERLALTDLDSLRKNPAELRVSPRDVDFESARWVEWIM
jgi:peptide/nickel transport system substrate-binding protein